MLEKLIVCVCIPVLSDTSFVHTHIRIVITLQFILAVILHRLHADWCTNWRTLLFTFLSLVYAPLLYLRNERLTRRSAAGDRIEAYQKKLKNLETVNKHRK